MTLNSKFKIPIKKFEEMIQTELSDKNGFKYVVPPTEITHPDRIQSLDGSVLRTLMHHVTLRGNGTRPYEHSDIEVQRRNPRELMIGQSFILKRKILELCQLQDLLERASLPGLCERNPLLITGNDSEGDYCCSIYCPPIAEYHNGKLVLIDGIHRSRIALAAGTSMPYIVVHNPQSPLPFEAQEWEFTELVDEKPPVEERYRNLNKALFRDLSRAGIDG